MRILRDFIAGRVLRIGQKPKSKQQDKGRESLRDLKKWLREIDKVEKKIEKSR